MLYFWGVLCDKKRDQSELTNLNEFIAPNNKNVRCAKNMQPWFKNGLASQWFQDTQELEAMLGP